MTVSSYIFQSPYPQAVQFGRPDPVAQAQEKTQAYTEKLSVTPSNTEQGVAYQTSLPSLNVATSSMDAGVTASLNSFASANSQVQAAAAYGS